MSVLSLFDIKQHKLFAVQFQFALRVQKFWSVITSSEKPTLEVVVTGTAAVFYLSKIKLL